MRNSSQEMSGVNNETLSLERFPRSAAITYVVVLIIESLPIIIGNAIVIAVFWRTRQLRQRKCYQLLINMAVADLLVGAIAGPLYVYAVAERSGLLWKRHPTWVPKTLGGIAVFLTYASVLNLVMLSLERMHATLWPLKHRVLGARNYHVMIGLSWSLAVFFTSIGTTNNLLQISNAFYYVLLFSNCLSLLVIIISYASIWIKIKFYKHPQHHMTTAQDRKLPMSLFLVTVASITTWFFATVLLIAVCSYPLCKWRSRNIHLHIFNSATLLLSASSLVNPIIYALKMPQFRRAALRLACRHKTEIPEPAIQRNRTEDINCQACVVTVNRSTNLEFHTRL